MATEASTEAPREFEDELIARFEVSMKELEDIVSRMERGELKLEESLTLFERGTQLAQQCRKSLESAELRVKKLLATQSAAGDEA